jgi:hypothetical protein
LGNIFTKKKKNWKTIAEQALMKIAENSGLVTMKGPTCQNEKVLNVDVTFWIPNSSKLRYSAKDSDGTMPARETFLEFGLTADRRSSSRS